jgi:general secretion pathway protein G
MATIAGMATIVAFPELRRVRVRTAKMGAVAVRQAAEMYQEIDHPGEEANCPTVDALVAARKLSAQGKDDPWGTKYSVTCGEEEIHGVSAGRDRRTGTPDDVRDDLKATDVDRVAEM